MLARGSVVEQEQKDIRPGGEPRAGLPWERFERTATRWTPCSERCSLNLSVAESNAPPNALAADHPKPHPPLHLAHPSSSSFRCSRRSLVVPFPSRRFGHFPLAHPRTTLYPSPLPFLTPLENFDLIGLAPHWLWYFRRFQKFSWLL